MIRHRIAFDTLPSDGITAARLAEFWRAQAETHEEFFEFGRRAGWDRDSQRTFLLCARECYKASREFARLARV